VERSSTRTAAAGTFLRFFQTIFENTPLWRLKRLVTLSTYRRYINECIYLSIYLPVPAAVTKYQYPSLPSQPHTHTTSVLQPLFRDHPGEPVPEENFWTLWCKHNYTNILLRAIVHLKLHVYTATMA